eukprot:351665-Chlamydomonas_euryale.AAC.4
MLDAFSASKTALDADDGLCPFCGRRADGQSGGSAPKGSLTPSLPLRGELLCSSASRAIDELEFVLLTSYTITAQSSTDPSSKREENLPHGPMRS